MRREPDVRLTASLATSAGIALFMYGAVGLVKFVVVDREAWLWLLRIGEFGGSLHPVRMIEAKPDLFYPLLTVVIFERHLNVTSRNGRGCPGVIF